MDERKKNLKIRNEGAGDGIIRKKYEKRMAETH